MAQVIIELSPLSSVLGKLLDRVILSKHHDTFENSDYQYGFKISIPLFIVHLW